MRQPSRQAASLSYSWQRHILVMDDKVAAAESLALLLRLVGHEVRTAHDGLGALAAAQAEPPDTVILDLGMPQIDGFKVARQLGRCRCRMRRYATDNCARN